MLKPEPLREPVSPLATARQRQRTQRLVWGACAVAAAGVILVIALLLFRDRADTLRQSENEAFALSTVLADHADRVIENADLVISQAASIAAPDGRPIATDRAIWQRLKELRDRSPYVSGIWIADAADNSVLTSYDFPAPRLNASTRDYVRFIKEHPDRLAIAHVPRSLYTHTPQFKITRRLGPEGGAYWGFITVDVSQEQFRSLYSRLNINPSSVLSLLDPAGQPLYQEPRPAPDQDRESRWEVPLLAAGRLEGASIGPSPGNGEDTLYVFRRSAIYRVISAVAIPMDSALGPWRSRLWIYCALAGAALTGIGAIGYGSVRWFSRHHARSEELECRVHERTMELEEALGQKEVLVAELNHRVKNTLAMVQSVARQTARGSCDLQTFSHDFDQRIRALSSTYALLTEADWRIASLRDLLQAELSPYLGEGGGRIRLNGPDIEMPAAIALSTGLVIHELTTNAAKYGALSTASGQVEVVWNIMRDDSDERLRISWVEMGGPAVSPPSRTGFGTRLMKTSYERTGGTVQLDFPETGARCLIEVPLWER